MTNTVQKLKRKEGGRIKILNENGFIHASIHIPYFSKKHVPKIKSFKGGVYTFDAQGSVGTQRLDKKDFSRNGAGDNLATINFTFPNLKAGSVIEYSYSKIGNDILALDSWDVQEQSSFLP